jgi:hypothetical protein
MIAGDVNDAKLKPSHQLNKQAAKPLIHGRASTRVK